MVPGGYDLGVSERRPRHTLVPNANNVGFLTRVMELIAQGVREPRALAEVLGCEVRTVHYYTQAGDWLGLLRTTKIPTLTRMGLEFVYAGRDQPRVYAEAVWGNGFVLDLMAGREGVLPDVEEIASFISGVDSEMAPTTARRRASAVRSLIEPAMRFHRSPLNLSRQLQLDFAPTYHPGGTATPILDLRAGMDDSPDVYRVLLSALIEHGELATGAVRAVLDASGARDASVGAYIDMATRRGDACRVDERLVVTWGAVWRREITETVVGVALSDPRYRSYLDSLLSPAPGEASSAHQAKAQRERFSGWDRRVFGAVARPAELGQELDRILLGRSLDTFPLAEDAGPEISTGSGAFLDRLHEDGLVIAFPPSLRILLQGVSVVNERLEAQSRIKNDVHVPEAIDRRVLVHGGLFPPGQPVPRSLPDGVTLRLQSIQSIPHVAMATALLLLHRRTGVPLEVQLGRQGPVVAWEGEPLDGLIHTLDRVADDRGWMTSRLLRSEHGSELLVDVLVALGIADRLAGRLVLDEGFFVRLRTEPEDQDVATRLSVLEEMVLRSLSGMVSDGG